MVITGVYSTAAGYTGGYTPNPTYREVCSGDTGHAEAVRIVYDPHVISYEQLLQVFWENHDPAQGMRQGNDRGTQYRSAIYPLTPEQTAAAQASLERFQAAMTAAGDERTITTEITTATLSTMPRTITSNICIKILMDIVALVELAFACRHKDNFPSGDFTVPYAILASEITGPLPSDRFSLNIPLDLYSMDFELQAGGKLVNPGSIDNYVTGVNECS